MSDENVTQETQPTEEPSRDAKLVEYYRSELEKVKAEIKELVGQRDLHKNEAMELKSKHSRKKPTESDEYKELFNENKVLKEQLYSIEEKTKLEKKKSLFINMAKEKGMTDEALKSIDRFNIDFSSINPEESISAEIMVESLKKEMGFLFQEKKSAPTPPDKLVEGDKLNKSKYMELLEKGDFMAAKEYIE